ncbi:MAG: phosphopantothenoylcysteine decarboxylase [Pseudobdellovibrionaceae bacterium]
MKKWEIKPPGSSNLLDHDVFIRGEQLRGRRVALLVTGGIAAMKAPLIVRALRRLSAEVVVFATEEALKYTTLDSLEWASTNPVVHRLSPQSEHLSKANPFDIFVMAPATYNSINKVRNGYADNAVTTTLATALGSLEKGQAKIVIAPVMHGDFHNSILQESLEFLQARGVDICPPRDEFGKHNLPDPENIAAFVSHVASKSSLSGRKILVTAGPTPVPIDNVRRIVNKFRGRLGIEIARHLYLSGADVKLLLGEGSNTPPAYLDTKIFKTYDDYKKSTLETLKAWPAEVGIFSAAVADYRPAQVHPGKIPSGGVLKSLDLVPTEKIIDLVQQQFPQTKMISFKYEENIEHAALVKKGLARVDKGHLAVVINRGEEVGPKGEQIAHLLTRQSDPVKWTGKDKIAQGLGEFLEGIL